MNNTIFFFFYSLAHQSAMLDKLIVFLAVTFPYVVVILAGIFLLFHYEVLKAESPARVLWEKKREFLTVFFSGVSAWILVPILKNLFQAQRPYLVLKDVYPLITKTTFAFPSEHASFFMALAFSIFFIHKKTGYVFMFLALIIGLARIAAGVHFPADILGGFILGSVIACLVQYFLRFSEKHIE